MKKVLFFTQDRWAFASIHRALEKELYKLGIYSNLLNWEISYTAEEAKLLNQIYDLFVTMPDAVPCLLSYRIPMNKIAVVAHAQWDMLLAKERMGVDFYQDLYKFGVVSPVLQSKAREFGIACVPDVVHLGVHFDLFYSPVSDAFKRLGYAGAYASGNKAGQEIKRGYMVDQVAHASNIELVKHGCYNWMCMPAYYAKIDAVAVSSSEEGAGLPSMEAAAAGRLVMSTPVGYFEHHGPAGGGVVLPMEESEYVAALSATINQYQDPIVYKTKCAEIQQYARDHYDWSHHIHNWVEFLS